MAVKRQRNRSAKFCQLPTLGAKTRGCLLAHSVTSLGAAEGYLPRVYLVQGR